MTKKVRSTFWRVSGSQSGQATTEYILLIAVVTGFYLTAFHYLSSSQAGKKISDAVTSPFQSTYTYGFPGAKGLDDGGPLNHPRAVGGTGNFRIFINPDKQ